MANKGNILVGLIAVFAVVMILRSVFQAKSTFRGGGGEAIGGRTGGSAYSGGAAELQPGEVA